jgi:hypothetical protein
MQVSVGVILSVPTPHVYQALGRVSEEALRMMDSLIITRFQQLLLTFGSYKKMELTWNLQH